MRIKNFFVSIALVLFIASPVFSQTFKYIGANKCKMCHNKTATGKQYDTWKAGPHAKAYESLASEASMKIAKERGIADPQKDAGCLKCHATTGHIDAKLATASIQETEGVSCESCHGPGSKYKVNSIMKDQAKAIENGLIVPTEEMCVTCHNEESPTYKGFDYAKYLAKIAHPNPKSE